MSRCTALGQVSELPRDRVFYGSIESLGFMRPPPTLKIPHALEAAICDRLIFISGSSAGPCCSRQAMNRTTQVRLRPTRLRSQSREWNVKIFYCQAGRNRQISTCLKCRILKSSESSLPSPEVASSANRYSSQSNPRHPYHKLIAYDIQI